MDPDPNEQLRIDRRQVLRRAVLVAAGFVAFLSALYFIDDPDDTLTLAILIVFYYIAVLLIPDRWFARLSRKRPLDASPPSGPRPALRSQPPPPPTRGNIRNWPPRYRPIPPPPPRPRRH